MSKVAMVGSFGRLSLLDVGRAEQNSNDSKIHLYPFCVDQLMARWSFKHLVVHIKEHEADLADLEQSNGIRFSLLIS